MIEIEEVRRMVEQKFPGVSVVVRDLTGTLDHFHIEVASEDFRGKSRLDQHRMVQASVQEALNDGRIHAVQIKTIVPA